MKRFKPIKNAADQALLFLGKESNQDGIAPSIRSMLERFSHPAPILEMSVILQTRLTDG